MAGGACSSGDGVSGASSTTSATTVVRTPSAPGNVTTTTTAPSSALGAADLCDEAELETVGQVSESVLAEISGVVASRGRPGALWVHNDSGYPADIWAIDHQGEVLDSFSVSGAESRDWEDIGIGAAPTAGRSYLYVGDIGDNAFTPVIGRGSDPRAADDHPVVIYRVPEPDLAATATAGSGSEPTAETAAPTEPATAFMVEYDDGPRDAEALLVDPISGDVFVISKQWDLSPPGLYRLPAELAAAELVADDAALDGVIMMERAADVAGPDGASGPGLITGADISADGALVALRTYDSVILWDRDLDDTVAETLAEPPTCTRTIDEPQGEAVAFGADGTSLVTISEGVGVPLNWLRPPEA